MRRDPSAFAIPPDFWLRPVVLEALRDRNIGSLFALVQKYTGASQAGLGMRAGGISQGEVSRIINGSRQIEELRVFEAIADGLEMPDVQRALLGIAPRQDDADVNRRDLLRYGLTAGAVSALPPSVTRSTLSAERVAPEGEALEWLAWEIRRRGVSGVHYSEMPARIANVFQGASLAGHSTISAVVTRSRDGQYGFTHDFLIDFFIARSILADIGAGRADHFSASQTSHQTDLVVGDFVATRKPTIDVLDGWMHQQRDPVLRVNSAGVLAKIGRPQVTDRVVEVLCHDDEARHRYLTAVFARAMALDWQSAERLAATVAAAGVGEASEATSARLVDRLMREITNTRDAGARWCSVFALSRLTVVRTPRVAQALSEALPDEPSREMLRAIGQVLAGNDPLAA